ncbi:MAG: hypothetical protein EBQ56_00260 [Proteobacteria bacterium]|nr:hypothetical protein [Pseudomonadota bacterium]
MWPTWVEVIGGTIAVAAVGALIYLAVADQSAAALTAITGIIGAATSTYFVPRQGLKNGANGNGNGINGNGTNGNGYGNGSPPPVGGSNGGSGAPDAPPRA